MFAELIRESGQITRWRCCGVAQWKVESANSIRISEELYTQFCTLNTAKSISHSVANYLFIFQINSQFLVVYKLGHLAHLVNSFLIKIMQNVPLLEKLATLNICSVHSTLQFYIHRLSTIGAQCLFTFWTCIDLPHLSLKVPQRYNALQCLLSVFHFHRHAFFPPSFPYFRFNTSK